MDETSRCGERRALNARERSGDATSGDERRRDERRRDGEASPAAASPSARVLLAQRALGKIRVLAKGRSRAAGLPTYQFLRSSTSARAARGCERSSRTVTGIEMLAGRPCVCITCCGGVRYVSLRHGIALCVSECENTGSVTSVRVFRPSFRTHAPTSIVRSTDGPLSMSVTQVSGTHAL